jgi:hypothetical protein
MRSVINSSSEAFLSKIGGREFSAVFEMAWRTPKVSGKREIEEDTDRVGPMQTLAETVRGECVLMSTRQDSITSASTQWLLNPEDTLWIED